MLKLSKESVEGLRKLKSDILTLSKKRNRSEHTGTTTRYNFIDVITLSITIGVLVIVSACVIKILQWMWGL